MNVNTVSLIVVLILFVAIIITHWIGFKVYKIQAKKDPSKLSKGFGPIEGSLLGLMALLLSFTFGMSASRYDARRQVIIEEANDIGTAILRCDMYPDSIRKILRTDFKEYVNARIEYYNTGTDTAKLSSSLKKTTLMSGRIWKTVMIESQNKDNYLRSQQMIPALNDMIDIVTTRDATKNATIPNSIVWLLFMLIITVSFIVGYSSASNNKKMKPFVVYGFALMTALTVYLILDLDRPRRGIVTTDAAHEKILELRELLEDKN